MRLMSLHKIKIPSCEWVANEQTTNTFHPWMNTSGWTTGAWVLHSSSHLFKLKYAKSLIQETSPGRGVSCDPTAEYKCAVTQWLSLSLRMLLSLVVPLPHTAPSVCLSHTHSCSLSPSPHRHSENKHVWHIPWQDKLWGGLFFFQKLLIQT